MASNNVVKIKSKWGYNIAGHFFVVLFIFITLCMIVIVKDSLFLKQTELFREHWYEYSKRFGLTLDDIVIEGRDNIKKQEVLTLLNINRESSFLAIDEKDIADKIKKLAWVKDVSVKKNYIPNVLQININEKKVIALFLKDNKFYPLDETGNVINAKFEPNEEYMIVSGENSTENVVEMLKIIAQNEHVFKRVKALQYISNRRWNIVLDDIEKGKIIKLPEDGYEKAWKKMIKLNTTHGILKRPLTIIDLRFDNKVIYELDKKSITNNKREVKT